MMFVLFFSMIACKNENENEMAEILNQFDLTDPKIFWTGTIEEEFTGDMVLMVLRKTSTHPELEARHFNLNNIEMVEYVGGARPPDYFFTPGYENALKDYRQIVFIHLKQHGKEKVIEAIRILEKLDFVMWAGPNHIVSIEA